MADEPGGDRPVAESPKAEKKQAGREKLIVGGTLALVILTYMIYRRSQTKQTASQGYPLGYGSSGGGGSGGGGSMLPPSFPTGGSVDNAGPFLPVPSSPPVSGTQPGNQTPGPGTGPTLATQPLPVVGSLNSQPVYQTPQGYDGQYLMPYKGPGGGSLYDLVDPRSGLAGISGLSASEASKYSGYTVVPHGSVPVPTGS